ncbi:PREDICTED: C-type lectin domain family 2 member D-like, partial [Chlamydotis macqueenii]|uniref:C-type lectin domain family 2 member D-like n=1 Tax=Chlamydotis macqueenii TaxID=187382 RepID=UPI00052990C1
MRVLSVLRALPPPRALSPGFSLKCIKEKKVPIAVTVVVAALLLAIIALAGTRVAARGVPPPLGKIPCPENGIGFGEKCFYFVEAEADWNRSQASCLSLGAHLAAIDSQEELSFLLRYGFPVRGNGQCAYINLDGISSDWCSQ